MLVRRYRLISQPLAGRHLGQPTRFLVLGIFVPPFLIEREEAVELHHGAGGAGFEFALADAGVDIGSRAFEFGGLHLACDAAQPDQFIKLGLICIEIVLGVLRLAGQIGRTNGLVGLLGILGLRLITARRQRDIVAAVIG